MIIAMISEILFVEDRNSHTVAYAEEGHRIATTFDYPFGSLKAIIADDQDDAILKLSVIARNYIKETGWNIKLNEKDFRFYMTYTEVEDSAFWLIPYSAPMKFFKII